VEPLDLVAVPAVDAHTHPYRLDELLSRGSEGFDTRITFAGESFLSSSKLDPSLWPFVDELTDSTMLALVLLRRLAEHLGCEPERAAVTKARDAALRADPVGYTRGLLSAANVVAVLSDEGFPQPSIPREEFEATIGTTVHRVARLEPWILKHRDGPFDDLVSGVEAEAHTAADDARCVAYKSIIAYRTGLDVGDPSASEAAAAFGRWSADGWRETREHAKPVRDFLLRRALGVAKERDRAFHIHCGAGDPDIDLTHAGPVNLWPLLVAHTGQPIVLIHSGYPWIGESAYIASVLPHVYLELSELIPWGWSMVDHSLEVILGTAPAAKVLYGSDEAGEPEMFWLAATKARQALGRVLGGFVEREDLSIDEAERFARMVLGENAARLHGFRMDG
jgi:predicted TIM-barrel fold metal-dependent hydrolase